MPIAGVRTDGETKRASLEGVDTDTIVRIDRTIAFGGPAAEIKFAGSAERGPCEDDFAFAEAASIHLHEDNATAFEAISGAFEDEAVWRAVTAIASAPLGVPEGIALDPNQVHQAIRQTAGPPSPPWPREPGPTEVPPPVEQAT